MTNDSDGDAEAEKPTPPGIDPLRDDLETIISEIEDENVRKALIELIKSFRKVRSLRGGGENGDGNGGGRPH